MATIECCEALSNSTKAKLQDAGILYLADLTGLLHTDGSVIADQKLAQMIGGLRTRLAQRSCVPAHATELLSNSADSATAHHLNSAEPDAMATTPIDHISFFTEGEVDEIFDAIRNALQTSETTHHAFGDTVSADVTSPVNTAFPLRTHLMDSKCCAEETAPAIPGCRSLRELLREVEEQQVRGQPTHATTFSRALDTLLGGGVPMGGVTEVCGPPGVGKTQLLMQLAVSCAMPVEFGGLGGTCVFVDTEGSFVAERLEQMATAAVALVKTILAKSTVQQTMRDTAATRGSLSDGNSLLREEAMHGHSTRKRARSESAGSGITTAGVATPTSPPPAETSANLVPVSETTFRAERVQGELRTSDAYGFTTTEAATHKPRPTRDNFTVERVLQSVRYVRVTELTDFLALLYSLPRWLRENTPAVPEKDTKAAAGPGLDSTKAKQDGTGDGSGADVSPVRMVLIDSVAVPFRAADTFEKNATTYDDIYGTHFSSVSTSLSGARASSYGALSRQGLWQRSRLLFQCSTALSELASSHELAVVVSNHMTTRRLRGTLGGGRSSAAASATEPDANGGGLRQTVLVPALGDAWGHGLSTRVLLAFHHYELPSCAFAPRTDSVGKRDEKGCLEDVVYSVSRTTEPGTAPPLVNRVVQHRVARLLKASGQPRCETCFLITSKGIRDVRKGMVKQWIDKPQPPPF